MHEMNDIERWAVYRIGVYVAWSDGQLGAEEISFARAIAEELELVGRDPDPGADLRRGPPGHLEVEPDALSVATRELAYGVAAWMALADARVHRAEAAVLRMLRHRLALPEPRARLIEASAHLAATPAIAARTRLRALMLELRDLREESGWRRVSEVRARAGRPVGAPGLRRAAASADQGANDEPRDAAHR